MTVKAADVESRATADSAGRWTLQVDLRRGENMFRISATDPATGKVGRGARRASSSRCRSVVIEAPTLIVDQPADGATYENGAIPVQGSTTNASSVVVERRVHRSGRDRSRAAPPAPNEARAR